MKLWVFLGLVKVFGVLAADGTQGGTRLEEAFVYTVYILKQVDFMLWDRSEDGSVVCLGVIMDSLTIVTAAHCKVQPRTHLVKAASLPETETERDIAIKDVQTIPADAELGLTIVRLEKAVTLLGDNKTASAMWDASDEHGVGEPGIVPAYGYPPKAVGLELVNKTVCQRRMLEIIDLEGWHDRDFPDSIMCARKAQEPVPMIGIGEIEPGMPCRDLGAPFVLNRTARVLGLLVYADCSSVTPKAFVLSLKDVKYTVPNATTPESTTAATVRTKPRLPVFVNVGRKEMETLRNAAAKLAPLPVIGSLAFNRPLVS